MILFQLYYYSKLIILNYSFFKLFLKDMSLLYHW